VATTHRLIVCYLHQRFCVRSHILEVAYRTGRRYTANAWWKPSNQTVLLQANFSTAISSVLHANFWPQLSTVGDNDLKSWPCYGRLRFSLVPVRTLSGYACTKLATFSFTPCFKAFSLVMFSAMLSRLRPNTMRKSRFNLGHPRFKGRATTVVRLETVFLRNMPLDSWGRSQPTTRIFTLD
jgi:hypothetical protein